MDSTDLIVIGGGPAGLMAAGQAARQGASTLLLEKMARPGRKLRITGKGRCNLTNVAPVEDFIAHFGKNGRFLRQAFARFFTPDLLAFFADLGVETVVERGGRVVIPAFAVGRTQEVLARLNDLIESGRLSGMPVFVDSPMAITATQIFAHHPEAYSEEARRLLRAGDEPLEFPGLELTRTVDESKSIRQHRGPCVIISASGMCEAGRILHHLKNNIASGRNGILMVGYQARHTLGRRIVEGERRVKIFGTRYPVRARVKVFNEFSAHADGEELLEFAEGMRRPPQRTIVVHGNEDMSVALGRKLTDRGFPRVTVPLDGETVRL